MINQKLQEFEDEFKSLGESMTSATIEMYEAIVQRFLPTPTRIHYLFNLRDILNDYSGLDFFDFYFSIFSHRCSKDF
jgi:dynein heavy chain